MDYEIKINKLIEDLEQEGRELLKEKEEYQEQVDNDTTGDFIQDEFQRLGELSGRQLQITKVIKELQKVRDL